MIDRKINFLFVAAVLILGVLACNAVLPGSQPTSAPTFPMVVSTPTPGGLPQTDAEVPRVSLVDAKAALDSGTALVVDVRSADSYQASHIAGAISIPLDVIQTDPSGVLLDKNQWIITYCS